MLDIAIFVSQPLCADGILIKLPSNEGIDINYINLFIPNFNNYFLDIILDIMFIYIEVYTK